MKNHWGGVAACFLFSGCFYMVRPPEDAQSYEQQNGYGEPVYSESSSGDAESSQSAYAAAPATSTLASAPAQPAAPASRSVTVHSDCGQTVGLFRGRGEPPFGSGTYGSMSSNSTTSYTLGPDESLWIMDDSRRGVAEYVPVGGERVSITNTCAGFRRD